jgi:RimJ/RimL family protein N-acetyltransferase
MIKKAAAQPPDMPPLVSDWNGARRPDHGPLVGMFSRVEALTRAHLPEIYDAFAADIDGAIWRYLPYGPFDNYSTFANWVDKKCFDHNPLFYAIIDSASGRACGMASYLRVNPEAGSIEVGNINFAPELQRSIAATEAMYLMMHNAFEALGYRRYEWKCNDANVASKAAALRLGFTAEGVHRQAAVIKGRNRDTAWFAVLDSEWPKCGAAFRDWLAPENFDDQGRQKQRLTALRLKSD